MPLSSEQFEADRQTAAVAIERQMDGLRTLQVAVEGDLGRALAEAVEILFHLTGRLIVTGVGKSGHVARKLASTFASTGTPTHFVHPSDASHGDLGMIRANDIVLTISWSGESVELANVVAYARQFKIPLIAITSVAESALGRAADVTLLIPAVTEACPHGLAPTTSTTAQLVLGDTLAICLLSRRKFTSHDFISLHPGGSLGMRLKRVRDLMLVGEAIPAVPVDAGLADAIYEMTSKRLGVTGVLAADGRLIGIVTDGDLRRSLNRGVAAYETKNVMRSSPCTIEADVLVEAALATMASHKITCLFVVDSEGRPAGLLTMHACLELGLAAYSAMTARA